MHDPSFSRYKAEASPSPGWRDFRTCSLDISIGNCNEEGEKLDAILRWIETRFDTCLVNLGDALYRYNLPSVNYDQDAALRESVQQGDRWIERHMPRLSELRIPFKVVRWQEWLNDANFSEWNRRIRELYFRDTDFRTAVEKDAEGFTGRNPAVSKDNSISYLLEEMAVHSLMANSVPLARVYPSERLHAAQYLADSQLGLEKEAFIRLLIKRRKDQAAAAA